MVSRCQTEWGYSLWQGIFEGQTEAEKGIPSLRRIQQIPLKAFSVVFFRAEEQNIRRLALRHMAAKSGSEAVLSGVAYDNEFLLYGQILLL